MDPRFLRLKVIALRHFPRIGMALFGAAILGAPSVLATGLRVGVRVQQEQRSRLAPKARSFSTCIEVGNESESAKVGICREGVREPAAEPSPTGKKVKKAKGEKKAKKEKKGKRYPK